MQAVERIPKKGRNEFHQYDYAMEADIVAAIRGELAQRDVMLIPAITGHRREPVGQKGSVLTHLDMEFTFFDGETGETITRPWLGAGADKEDKGAYKAMTGGEKYFLLKTFLIPTGDDPETEDGHPRPPEPRRAETKKPKAPDPRDPDDPLPDAYVHIMSVQSKKGTGKNGKPFEKYTITDSNGQQYATFSGTLAKTAIKVRDSGVAVELRSETDKYGKTLTEIIGLGPRQHGEEG